jgi:hypothetical protein
MRLIPLIPAALIAAAPLSAQDWQTVTAIEDGFRSNFPGQPTVERIVYESEFRLSLPGRVYRASDALGNYSTTVVDYRDVGRQHNERSAACLAAKGANQQDGDTCQNDFVMEVAGAMDHAAAKFLERDGVKITHYGTYFLDMVSGRLIQLTNPDKSRMPRSTSTPAGCTFTKPRCPRPCRSRFCSYSRSRGSTARAKPSAIGRCTRKATPAGNSLSRRRRRMRCATSTCRASNRRDRHGRRFQGCASCWRSQAYR